MASFARWLEDQKVNTPIGKFGLAWINDPDRPLAPARIDEILSHLRARDATPELLAAARAAWVRWRGERRATGDGPRTKARSMDDARRAIALSCARRGRP